MKRGLLNFIVDLCGLAGLLGLLVTGFVIKYVLPPGSGGLGRALHDGRGREQIKSLLSLTRHEWGDIHFYLSVLFTVLVALHLVLHWAWIKSYVRSLFESSQKAQS